MHFGYNFWASFVYIRISEFYIPNIPTRSIPLKVTLKCLCLLYIIYLHFRFFFYFISLWILTLEYDFFADNGERHNIPASLLEDIQSYTYTFDADYLDVQEV